ncbi:MAG TPA: tRNA-dihydrouridine synthase, partial [Spirochaetota bacterium]|nr:tRNA-dihydrouridine synthase [Spirochaetota bacterium]
QNIVAGVVKTVNLPVTVKTRLGWDMDSINITEIARRIEDAGAKMLTVHCRTRSQGHSGRADWSYIEKIKKTINIPVILNGDIDNAAAAGRALQNTPADGIMVGRAAAGAPWIFTEIKEYLRYGRIKTVFSLNDKIRICLRHLKGEIDQKGEKRAIPAFRKFYGNYFKAYHGIASLRRELMQLTGYETVKNLLYRKLDSISIQS